MYLCSHTQYRGQQKNIKYTHLSVKRPQGTVRGSRDGGRARLTVHQAQLAKHATRLGVLEKRFVAQTVAVVSVD